MSMLLVRLQLLAAVGLFGYAISTRLVMPQGFNDYLARCIVLPLALFLALDAYRSRSRLTWIEDFACSLLCALLLVSTTLFVWEALEVRRLSNR